MINLPQVYLLHDDRFRANCHKRIDQLYELNKKSDDPILLEVIIQEQTDTKRTKERRHIFALIGDIIKAAHEDEYGKQHSKEGWFYKFKIEYNYIYDTVTQKIGEALVDIPIQKSISDSAKGEERMSFEEAQELRWKIEEYLIDHDIPMTEFR